MQKSSQSGQSSTDEPGADAPFFIVESSTVVATSYLMMNKRTLYHQAILQALAVLQTHAGRPEARCHVEAILQAIRDLEEHAPVESLLEVWLAFYDALAYEDLWLTYTAQQYQIAHRILAAMGTQPIPAQQIEETIAALDGAGFDTMPYVFTLDEE